MTGECNYQLYVTNKKQAWRSLAYYVIWQAIKDARHRTSNHLTEAEKKDALDFLRNLKSHYISDFLNLTDRQIREYQRRGGINNENLQKEKK